MSGHDTVTIPGPRAPASPSGVRGRAAAAPYPPPVSTEPDRPEPEIERAFDRLIDVLPATFRVDWAARLHRAKGVVYGTSAAPEELEFVEIEAPVRLEVPEDEVTLYAAARLDGNEVVVIGRRGGPEFADSEIARLGHRCGLANTIATAND